MAGAEDVIFNRAVNFSLRHAIPTQLDRCNEFALGGVLVFEKKLRPLMPWRKHRLVFTGVNINKLLKEPIDMESKVEVTYDKTSTSRTFGVDAKVDAEIQDAVAHFGVHVAATEHASMSVDFGKVERHYIDHDLLGGETTKQHQVLTTDSVIKDAIAHNRTLFVINSLYVAEKAEVDLKFTGDSKGINSKPAPTPVPSVTPPSTTTTTTSATTTTTSTGTVPTQSTPPTATGSSASANIGALAKVGGDVSVSIEKTGSSGNWCMMYIIRECVVASIVCIITRNFNTILSH